MPTNQIVSYAGMTEVMASSVMQAGAGLIAAAAAAIIAMWGIESQRRIARRQKTVEHISHVDRDHDMIKARLEFIALAQSKDKMVEYGKLQDPNEEQQKTLTNIRLVLNDFELISVSIQQGVMDNTLYHQFHRGTVIEYWKSARPFVDAVREQYNNSKLFYEFEMLSKEYENNPLPKRNFKGPRL
jgi:hypothetical protein